MQHRDHIFGDAIVGDNDDDRPPGVVVDVFGQRMAGEIDIPAGKDAPASGVDTARYADADGGDAGAIQLLHQGAHLGDRL